MSVQLNLQKVREEKTSVQSVSIAVLTFLRNQVSFVVMAKCA